jgi:hypothetical protein
MQYVPPIEPATFFGLKLGPGRGAKMIYQCWRCDFRIEEAATL